MYDFESGNLSLDFANTNEWHASEHPVEHLTDYSDLVNWGLEADLLTTEAAEQLRQMAIDHPEAAAHAYDSAIQLREAIYQVFSHHFAGTPVPKAALALLNDFASHAMAHMQIIRHESTYQWSFPSTLQGVDLILWPIARQASQLLTSDTATRVRECEDDRGCGYLFIDQTKNHSRRWCSMESCGNRAKAKRHYSRLQAS
jgi:predicted RNA-binding Zn ribbon-like protein